MMIHHFQRLVRSRYLLKNQPEILAENPTKHQKTIKTPLFIVSAEG
jgi:hypothetical protein